MNEPRYDPEPGTSGTGAPARATVPEATRTPSTDMTRRASPVEGELQERTIDPADCPVRLFEIAGDAYRYRWECTGGAHSGNGAHTSEHGRQRGIAEHREQFTQDRDRTTRWRPV